MTTHHSEPQTTACYTKPPARDDCGGGLVAMVVAVIRTATSCRRLLVVSVALVLLCGGGVAYAVTKAYTAASTAETNRELLLRVEQRSGRIERDVRWLRDNAQGGSP